ncbi:MAG: endonuclease domain-containing protein [Candidatus Omnitrophota bacterium]|nr:endonuclease domain-containing protein [Candidatus Omnitrophota bacterium]
MKRNNVEKSRRLRENQTDSERKLWSILRNRQLYGVKFRRQFPFGRYIIDFYSPEHKFGIEADGGQHYDAKSVTQDEARTKTLAKYGIRIMRFSDSDVLNDIEGVYDVIRRELERDIAPSP